MDLDRCYHTLGLQASASAEQVRRAYLELVKTWHPDHFGESPLLRLQAEETLKRINTAYAAIRSRRPTAVLHWRPLAMTIGGILMRTGQALVRGLALLAKTTPHRPSFPQHRLRRDGHGPPPKTFRQVLNEVRAARRAPTHCRSNFDPGGGRPMAHRIGPRGSDSAENTGAVAAVGRVARIVRILYRQS